MSGKGLEYYVKELQRKPYIYEEHVLPHDAEARELGTGKTRIETLRDLGLRKTRVLKRQTIEDRIHAARMLLPKVYFDMQKCDRGLQALKNYQKKWDSKNKIYMDKPLHDWSSNGADSFGYLAQGLRPSGYNARIKELPREAEVDYDVLGG